ncbi:MAG: nucleotidyltransferase family protein [Thiobacillaceae bacterium]
MQFIKATIARYFGQEARVWLFGSRVDDARRGGDVDLYVEVPAAPADLFMQRIRCLGELKEGLPYPVDLVIADASRARAIDRIAKAQGVLL